MKNILESSESLKMDYFWIMQDKRYLNTPVISNIQDIVFKRRDVIIENEKKIPSINVAFAKPQRSIEFIDILDSQLFLIRDRVKEVFAMYEPAMIFKTVCILANFTGEYANYYMPISPKIDCLSEKSMITIDRCQVKKLVLNSTKICSQSIFRVSKLETDVMIIRLDVMESLLRRKIMDFQFKKIELSDD